MEDYEAANWVTWEAEKRCFIPCTEQWRAAWSEPHPPEGEIALLLHDLANEIPFPHANSSASQYGIAV